MEMTDTVGFKQILLRKTFSVPVSRANILIIGKISATAAFLARCTYIETVLDCCFFVRTSEEVPSTG